MRKTAYGVLLAAIASLAWIAHGATPQKKAPARKTTSAKSKTGSKRPAVTWRNRQMSPTQDRYREIQSALAAKGYMSPEEATGSWGPSSVDALKRFQADQKIASSGKINSLSLIALGLGPKRDTPVVVPPPDPAVR